MLADKNTYINSAYKHLQVISQDKQKQMEYEAREKAVRDYNQGMFEAEQRGLQQGLQQGMQQGLQQGMQQTVIQIANKMILLNLDINSIIESTGLTIAEVQELKDKLNTI